MHASNRREFLKLGAARQGRRYSSPFESAAASWQKLERSGAAQKVIVVGAGLAAWPSLSYYVNDLDELYNLRIDLKEMRNLTMLPEYKSKVEEMKAQLFAWPVRRKDLDSAKPGIAPEEQWPK